MLVSIRMRLSIDSFFLLRELLVHRIVDHLTMFSLVFCSFHMLNNLLDVGFYVVVSYLLYDI